MKLMNYWVFMCYYNNNIVKYMLSIVIVFKCALRLVFDP